MFILIAYIFAFFVTAFTASVIVGIVFFPPVRKKIIEKLSEFTKHHEAKKQPELLLKRPPINPILKPHANLWEAVSVMNPAAIHLDGKIHLIYRAIGADGVSRLGYASSNDGINFDTVLPYPVYAVLNPGGAGSIRRYSPVLYPSGGSWGGCEDPRMVVIDENVYVTFNLFDNWVLRIGVISISKDNFIANRFNKWSDAIILSNSNREKNWMLFPEKIHGKFAVLHGIIDEDENRVRIEYTDNLNDLSKQKFETVDPQTVPDKKIAWHMHVRSAGPPPIKTKYGWLVLYHAHDQEESSRYKLGAMLLDLNDPTKILHRSPHPILEPDAVYENDGKPGVIYACGAVIKDDTMFVYYGGADKITAVASAPAESFLQALSQDKTSVEETELSLHASSGAN